MVVRKQLVMPSKILRPFAGPRRCSLSLTFQRPRSQGAVQGLAQGQSQGQLQLLRLEDMPALPDDLSDIEDDRQRQDIVRLRWHVASHTGSLNKEKS